MKIILAIVLILNIICSAIADAQFKNYKFRVSKIWENASIVLWFVIVYLFFITGDGILDLFLLLGSYTCFRFTFFDITWNLTRDLDYIRWDYYGSTSGWYSSFRFYIQGIYPLLILMSFILGISLIFNEL